MRDEGFISMLDYDSPKLPKGLDELADGVNLFCYHAMTGYPYVKCEGSYKSSTYMSGCMCKGKKEPHPQKASKWKCKQAGDWHSMKIPKEMLKAKVGVQEHHFQVDMRNNYVTVDYPLMKSWASTPMHLIKSIFEEGPLRVEWKKNFLHLYHRGKHMGVALRFNDVRSSWKIAKDHDNHRAFFRFKLEKRPKLLGKEWKGK